MGARGFHEFATGTMTTDAHPGLEFGSAHDCRKTENSLQGCEQFLDGHGDPLRETDLR